MNNIPQKERLVYIDEILNYLAGGSPVLTGDKRYSQLVFRALELSEIILK
jgi:hypothetical protein